MGDEQSTEIGSPRSRSNGSTVWRTEPAGPRWFRPLAATHTVDGLRGLFLADGLLQELRPDRFR